MAKIQFYTVRFHRHGYTAYLGKLDAEQMHIIMRIIEAVRKPEAFSILARRNDEDEVVYSWGTLSHDD